MTQPLDEPLGGAVPPGSHPLLTATAAIDAALSEVAEVNPTFMRTAAKAEALRRIGRIEGRLAELRLRVLAVAGDVAEAEAARDPGQWWAHRTRNHRRDARPDRDLAEALDQRWAHLAAGMRDGTVNLAQARVIHRALTALPAELPAEELTRAEVALVGYAPDFGPEELSRLGRRILAVVAPEIAEAVEARQLARLEAEARHRTRLRMRRLGDGTTRLSGVIPDAAATRLAAYLEAFTNPRKAAATSGDQPDSDQPAGDPVERLPHPRKLGEAFCSLLENVDPHRLPLHGGDATTVMVTISLESLRAELGTADLLGAATIPGDDHAGTGETLTAGEVRRLACRARILPAVLGGPSEILDLGRARRLASAAQQRALLLRDRTCRAEGCTIPGTWAEAHHWVAWAAGGTTDLAQMVLLCSHHHHQAHDDRFEPERLPNGDVRFHRRR